MFQACPRDFGTYRRAIMTAIVSRQRCPKSKFAIAPQEEREGGGQPIRTRRFLSPRVQGEFSVRRNRNHVHIVQTKVGVLSLPHAKLLILLEFPGSPITSGGVAGSVPSL